MDWLSDNHWAGWLSAAVALGVIEVFSLDLIFAMLAFGAVVGLVSSALGAAFLVSFLLALGTAGATLFLLRPPLIKRLHGGPDLTMSHGRLVGSQGVAVSRITGVEVGQVRLAGELWSAAPYDDTLAIEPGEAVEVLEIRGATAYVHPVPRLDP
ncbi:MULTISPECIES: NfeD family protein [Nocardioides]|uniref:Membrane protein implicated in regulation of membrane protease activity n=1 Tax=Nocardioides lianchengensis TaxID=1045774 RepID=A0A1G6SP86_9ACTN|nr:NfeD family protein [Nocardioides lianchengensis]NYG09918.1 membrane protein implicated in regulation of membrane protease activity [Nocardioides lianchengensis]SDD18710.1 Membrane protein implicated in regulation of membrane protease activity [Nocardioides lianchengensis]